MQKHRTTRKIIIVFALTVLFMLGLFFKAVNTGGIETSAKQLLRGLFIAYDPTVAIIWELRIPRILVALLGGALMAMSGVLMQAVMKNPLADPGIIGITSGSALMAVVVSAFVPALAGLTPLFSFAGGMAAFALVYTLAWNGQIRPVRLILVGIAVDALFTGLTNAFSAATGGTYSGAMNIINSNISLKTWEDVKVLLLYFVLSSICCIFLVEKCNLLALSDQTMHSLGMNVNRFRILVSLVSVLMASIFTAIVGNVSFLGLVVPHMARLLVGSNHKVLIPYSAVLGAAVFLLADTVGRTIAYPYEISASIIMSVIGGPMFIILLKRSRGVYA